MSTYINKRVLAFKCDFQLRLSDRDIAVSPLDIRSNWDGYVDIAYGLVPFVGKAGLLLVLLRFGFGIFLLALFGSRRSRHGEGSLLDDSYNYLLKTTLIQVGVKVR